MLCYIRESSSKMRLSSELFQSCVSQSSFGPNTLLQVKSYEFKALTKAINCLQINPAKTNFERENDMQVCVCWKISAEVKYSLQVWLNTNYLVSFSRVSDVKGRPKKLSLTEIYCFISISTLFLFNYTHHQVMWRIDSFVFDMTLMGNHTQRYKTARSNGAYKMWVQFDWRCESSWTQRYWNAFDSCYLTMLVSRCATRRSR